jgi:hypothetical protein
MLKVNYFFAPQSQWLTVLQDNGRDSFYVPSPTVYHSLYRSVMILYVLADYLFH